MIINDSRAKVHTVAGRAFLVTSGIFQQYCRTFPDAGEWRALQKRFEALRLHRKRPNGLNIWTCRVQGPRKTSLVKGYLIEQPEGIFETVPADNPFLRLVEDEP
ncbi:MAG: DNA-binding domain-containing protein [Pseudomonadota bacterium]